MPITLPALLDTPTPRTLTCEADDELFALASHGLAAGNTVVFSDLTGGTGITAGTNYYVIASGLTTGVFRVSATRGGSTINVSADLTDGLVVRVPNWEDLKTIFGSEDLGWLSKYWRVATGTDLTDAAVFDRATVASFYRWRNLPN